MDAQKTVCSEPGCGRGFSTKLMLDFHMEKEHGKQVKSSLITDRKALSEKWDRENTVSLPEKKIEKMDTTPAWGLICIFRRIR